jgi:hypothetical protein
MFKAHNLSVLETFWKHLNSILVADDCHVRQGSAWVSAAVPVEQRPRSPDEGQDSPTQQHLTHLSQK